MPKKKVYKPPKVTVYKPEKPKIKPSFNPRSRFPGIADKFFRYFTMFLVILLLFTMVFDGDYTIYKDSVAVLYDYTEGISDVVRYVMDSATRVSGFVGDFSDSDEVDGVLSLKIKGDWIDFIVVRTLYRFWGADEWFIINGAPDGYEWYVGRKVQKTLFMYHIDGKVGIHLGEFEELEVG